MPQTEKTKNISFNIFKILHKIHVNMTVVAVTTSINMPLVVLCARKVRAESWTRATEGQLWFRCSSVCAEIVTWSTFFMFRDIYF